MKFFRKYSPYQNVLFYLGLLLWLGIFLLSPTIVEAYSSLRLVRLAMITHIVLPILGLITLPLTFVTRTYDRTCLSIAFILAHPITQLIGSFAFLAVKDMTLF